MANIKFKYKDTDYELTYTMRTVRDMESQGFDFNEIDKKPMTMIPLLFSGAFKAKHPFVNSNTIDEIFKQMPNKEELYQELGKMYAETLNKLTDEPEEGNISWTMN